jgi:membrane-bound serine protease (ClpP class)
LTTVITLIILGAALLVLETVLPGLVAGFVGLCCLMGGVALAYIDHGMQVGTLVLLAVLVGGVLGIVLYLKYFPESRVAGLFISRSTVGDLGVGSPDLVERTGTALTPLRPSGMALIEGRRVDVVTEGPFLERGAALRVVAVEGMRVVVREIG